MDDYRDRIVDQDRGSKKKQKRAEREYEERGMLVWGDQDMNLSQDRWPNGAIP